MNDAAGRWFIGGVAVDMPERKRAGERMLDEQRRCEQLVHFIDGIFWEADPVTFNFTYVSAAGERLLGYPIRQWLSEPEFWTSHIHPDDREAALSVCLANLRAQGTVHFDYRMVAADGRIMWFRDVVSVVSEQGRPIKLIGIMVDITASKQVEERLRQSEAFIDSIVEHLPHMVFVKDARDLRFVRFNKAGEELLGRSRDALLGKSDYDLFPKNEAEFFTSKDREVLASGRLMDIQEEVIHAACGPRILHTKKVPIAGADGAPRYLLGISEDITERKRMEKRADSHAVRLKKLSEWSLALSGDLDDVFEQAARVLGEIFDVPVVCVSEIAGDELWFKAVFVNGKTVRDAGRCPLAVTPCATVEKTKDLRVFDRVMEQFPEAEFFRDHRAVVYCGAPSLDSRGQVVAVICLLDDKPRDFAEEERELVRLFSQRIAVEIERARHLAERKQAEDQLRQSDAFVRSVLDNLPITIFVKEADGLRHVQFNRACEELLGLGRRDILNKTNDELFPPEVADRLTADDRAILAGGRLVEIPEETIQTAQGLRLVRTKKVPLCDPEGRPRYLLGLTEDITERKRTEDTLKTTAAQLSAVIESSPLGIVMMDADSTVRVWNSAAARLFGWSADEVIGRPYPAVPESRREEHRLFREGTMQGQAVVNAEVVRQRKDGTIVEVALSTAPLRGADGQICGAMGILQDITERKQMEEALRRSHAELERRVIERTADLAAANAALQKEIAEHRQTNQERAEALHGLETVMETVPDIIYSLDRHGNLSGWNKRLETVTGYAQEELRGKSALDLVPSKEHAHTLAAIRQAFETGYAELEGLLLAKDGRTIPYHWTGAAVKDRMGQVFGITGVGRDMTERKAMEARLRTTQYAVDHAADQIFIIGSDGYFRDVNESACHRLGYTKQELLTMSVMDIDPDFPPAVWRTFWEEFARVKRVQLETRHRSKSGEVYPVEVVANYHLHNGLELDCAIVRDITERKRAEKALQVSEERFAYAIESTDDGIWDWNIQSGAVYFSPQWIRLLGYQPDEVPPSTEFFFSILHPEDVARTTQVLQEHLEGRIPIKELEVRLRQKSGEYGWYLDRGKVVLRDQTGNPLRMVGTITDITARKQLEQQLIRQNEELERLVAVRAARIGELETQRAQTEKLAALGQLAAGVAHEINNPIAGIRNAFFLIKQAIPSSHPYYEFVPMIEREIDRVAAIVQQLYMLYRRDSGRITTPIDLPVLIQDIRELLAKRLAQRRLNLNISLPNQALELHVPRGDFLQVLLNLLQNAIDSSADGKTVSLSVSLDSESYRVAVGDEGVGIASHVLPKIFDPFFTTKEGKELKGMGLGLAVSQTLVQAMGGQIQVQTAVNEGSIFTIVLPKRKAVGAANGQPD